MLFEGRYSKGSWYLVFQECPPFLEPPVALGEREVHLQVLTNRGLNTYLYYFGGFLFIKPQNPSLIVKAPILLEGLWAVEKWRGTRSFTG